MRNPIKMTPVLHPGVEFWIERLVGVTHFDESETTWMMEKLCFKFQYDRSSETLPRWPPSWNLILDGQGGLGQKHHGEAVFQISSRLVIRNPFQDDPLPLFWSWILDREGGWRWPSWWVRNIIEKLYFRFYYVRSSRAPSKWPLSSILELDPWWTGWLERTILMGQKHHWEAAFQISSRLVIRNPIKITPIFHPGVGSLMSQIHHWEALF